jgi:hypothetical protein
MWSVTAQAMFGYDVAKANWAARSGAYRCEDEQMPVN